MKLYYHPASVPSRRTRLAAALLGIDLELQLVDVLAGAHRKPDYLAINPNGMVPTLDDDGFVLWESCAIQQYLAAKAPDLFPSDPKARADVSRWQCWDLAHWTRVTQTLVFERMFKKLIGMGEPDLAAIERGTKDFHRFAAVLDGHLAGRNYLVGNRVTLADLSVAVGLTYAVPAGIPVGGYQNIQRWFASIEALDAWKSTAPPAMG
jgi:glutathione S-transferase